jgi:hypothetical protein
MALAFVIIGLIFGFVGFLMMIRNMISRMGNFDFKASSDESFLIYIKAVAVMALGGLITMFGIAIGIAQVVS